MDKFYSISSKFPSFTGQPISCESGNPQFDQLFERLHTCHVPVSPCCHLYHFTPSHARQTPTHVMIFKFSHQCLIWQQFPQTHLSLPFLSLEEDGEANYNYFHGDGRAQKARLGSRGKKFDHVSSRKVNYLSLTPFLIQQQKIPERIFGLVASCSPPSRYFSTILKVVDHCYSLKFIKVNQGRFSYNKWLTAFCKH